MRGVLKKVQTRRTQSVAKNRLEKHEQHHKVRLYTKTEKPFGVLFISAVWHIYDAF
jgi:hypothetical protein